MQDAQTYIEDTRPAVEGLFKLLDQYNLQEMREFVDVMNSKTKGELEANNSNMGSKDFAREVIAGSILQIAYVAIAKYGSPGTKSTNVAKFESEINKLIKENPSKVRWKKKRAFELPSKFCVGRDLDLLPLGMVVYAGRNQYNHFFEGNRLSVENELVFNHLHALYPNPRKGLSFEIRPNKLFSYSILAALGWIDRPNELGYVAYNKDICDVLQVTLNYFSSGAS
jgi:hypothetical protein